MNVNRFFAVRLILVGTASPVGYRHAPPDLGADTEDVLRWLATPEEEP